MTSFLMLLGLALVPPAVYANEQHRSTSNGGKTMSTQSFVNEAARGGMAAVELGRLAVQRALDPDIKAFAQRMVDDHTRANDELKQLAERKKWKLPTQTTSTQEMTYNRLHDKAGADFDREYAKAMVKHHDHDVKMFETYAESGKDADLKSFAASTIATLRDHQQMARANASKLGVDVASHETDGKEAVAKK